MITLTATPTRVAAGLFAVDLPARTAELPSRRQPAAAGLFGAARR